jgi:single-strand DNA-binding protein
MNRIVLVGRLESTPELRHTSTGIPVANFSLSVRRSIPNGQGRYERDVFRVVTWRKLAETCCRFLERGRMIAVDGKLQNRLLQSPNGDRRTIVEIHADDVRFLEGAKPRNEVGDNGQQDYEPEEQAEDIRRPEPVEVSAEPQVRVQTQTQTQTQVKTETVEVEAESASEDGVPDYNDNEAPWFNDENDGTPLEF